MKATADAIGLLLLRAVLSNMKLIALNVSCERVCRPNFSQDQLLVSFCYNDL